MLDAETQNKLSEWRRKSMEGTATVEEMRAAILALRGNRRSAVESSAKKSRSTKGPTRSVEDMLSELDGLS